MGEIKPLFSFWGFQLDQLGVSDIKNCKYLEENIGLLHLKIFKLKNGPIETQKLFQQCRIVSKKVQFMILNDLKDFTDHDKLETSLKETGFTLKERTNIQKIFAKKNKGLRGFVEKWLRDQNSVDQKDLSTLYLKNAKKLKFIKSSSESFIKDIWLAETYLRLENEKRALDIFKKYITDFYPWLYFRDYSDETYSALGEQIEKKLIESLSFLASKLEKNDIFELFIWRLADISPLSLKNKIADFVQFEPSLQVLREKSRSFVHGWPYANIWFAEILKRSSTAEALEYLEEYYRREKYFYSNNNYQSFYQAFLPNDKAARDWLCTNIEKKINSSQLFERYEALKFLEIDVLREYFYKKTKRKKVPYFKLERSFFKRTLKEGKGISFSTFQFIKLGDYNQDLIWHLGNI